LLGGSFGTTKRKTGITLHCPILASRCSRTVWYYFIANYCGNCLQGGYLSSIHKDPFDRLIIATSIVYQGKLTSIDNLFSQYSELDPYLMRQNILQDR
jgi:hypothetical protein